MRYKKPTVRNVANVCRSAWDLLLPKNAITVRRVNDTLYINLPRGMRKYSIRRYLRDNALIPTFGKRAAGGIKFERHSWWEN